MARDFTLKQLQYFAALSESGTYRKAAERVGISQPSLSLQITNLETTLGITLVERGRAGAVLTPAGREVLARVRIILDEASQLAALPDQMGAGLHGTIKLGASPTLGPYLLPAVVAHLHEAYPDLRLIIRDGPPADLVEALLAGAHDLILTQLPVPSTDVSVTRLFREPLYLTVAKDHRLAGAETATEGDLRDETVLSLSSRFVLHSQMTDLAQRAGAVIRQDYEGTSLDALRQMTAMNMGVTFLPALYARSEIQGRSTDVALVPFQQGRFTRSLGLVRRKTSGSGSPADRLADIIRDVVRTQFFGLVQLEG